MELECVAARANLWVESRFLSRDLVEHVLHVRPELFVVDRLLVVADQLMLHGIDDVDIVLHRSFMRAPVIQNTMERTGSPLDIIQSVRPTGRTEGQMSEITRQFYGGLRPP